MSLINYVEPVSIGGIFAGIGSLLFSIVVIFLIVKICKPLIDFITLGYNREIKYAIVEEDALNKIAKEKGIDIEKELVKRNVLRKQRKTFRRKLEEDVYNEMFGKDKVETK